MRLAQGFAAHVPQESLKHAVLDALVWGTDLFSLRLTDNKMTTAIHCEQIKIIPIFLSDQQKIRFLACCGILVISLCVPWDEEG